MQVTVGVSNFAFAKASRCSPGRTTPAASAPVPTAAARTKSRRDSPTNSPLSFVSSVILALRERLAVSRLALRGPAQRGPQRFTEQIEVEPPSINGQEPVERTSFQEHHRADNGRSQPISKLWAQTRL